MLKLILKKINQLLDLMLEEREDRKRERETRDQERSEKEMLEYVKMKQKEMEPPVAHTSLEDQDAPVRTKAKILVPFNMSEEDKIILEDFYNKD